MVKSSLWKSVGSLCLTKPQLSALATEARGILYSRPLIYVNSANSFTPNHFLSPISKVGTQVLNNNDDDIVDQQDKDSH